jgi:epoxyqueuosine reductase QueG
MVCFGIPVPRGAYEAAAHSAELVWRTQSLLYRRLDTISLSLAELIEGHGAHALPVFGCAPLAVNGKGAVVGYVSQIRMGEILGIGKIGRNGLLLNSKYGSRLMLGAVLTTEELPSARFPDVEESGCPPGCRICVDACPARAIRGDAAEDGRVDIMRCLAYTAITPFMSRPRFALLARFAPASAARLMNLRAFDEHTMHVCSRCIAKCPYGNPRAHRNSEPDPLDG